jgi:uncharacterized protein (TIGR00730 family)
MKRICVFTGSSRGERPEYGRAAEELAHELVARGMGLVYGGSNVGLMGLMANAMLKHGGHVIGVIPEALVAKEIAHQGLSELRITGSMHERKAVMVELADGFVALPGGLGTLEEFFEVLTWAQLGFHTKPCGIVNTLGYFDRLLAFLDHSVEERFVGSENRSMVLSEATPRALLDRMASFTAPKVEKWMDRNSL